MKGSNAVYDVLIEVDCLSRLPNKYLWSLIDGVINAATSGGIEIRYCTRHESRFPYTADVCQDVSRKMTEPSWWPTEKCTPADFLLIEDER